MQIFNEFQSNIKNVSLALGFFDGVHLGHQEVIKSAVKQGKTAVVSFKLHPMETFGQEWKYINQIDDRAKLIAELGVDYLFELDFTSEMSSMAGEEYLKTLIDVFEPKSVTTGFNHTFGRGKSGTPALLEKCQNAYGYKYFQIPPKTIDDEVVSSTSIKNYITQGEIEKANKMLGYNFSVKGRVIRGNRLGHQIGFPTANIKYPESIIELPYGAYSTKVENNLSIANYGEKPTVGEFKPVLETHIFNFNKNIYDTKIEITFIKKLRDEKKFSSLDELKTQINKDISECLK